MRVTVDANILFSALLRKGITRKIWFVPELELYSPRFLLTEFQRYNDFLQKKFGNTSEEFKLLSQKLLSQILFVPDDELKPFLPAVVSLITDPKDWLYLACALRDDTVVWSNDAGFKRQSRIKVYNTKEMAAEVGTL